MTVVETLAETGFEVVEVVGIVGIVAETAAPNWAKIDLVLIVNSKTAVGSAMVVS